MYTGEIDLSDLSPGDLGLPNPPFAEFRKEQVEGVRFITGSKKRFRALCMPGGCHGDPNAKILLATGSVSRVSDVYVGQKLSGPFGQVRTVLSTSTGVGRLYEIRPVKGATFTVNSGHMLSLKKLRTGYKHPSDVGGSVIDISVEDYIRTSTNFKRSYVLFRTAVDKFTSEAVELPADPYLVGLILGDGATTNGSVSVCKPDMELLPDIQRAILPFGVTAKFMWGTDGHLDGWRLSKPNRDGGPQVRNRLTIALENLGIMRVPCGLKFVPSIYATAALHSRLEILAGLIDTDGSLAYGGYDYISKSRKLSEGVCFLARSVGLAAYIKPCEKFCQTGEGGVYYRVFISGDCGIVPCRIPRKKAGPRLQKKDVLHTGLEVKEIGRGEYWGFTLDGDGRYLLDDFTVTHNSGKSLVSMALAQATGWRTAILTSTKALQAQYAKDGRSIGMVDIQGKSNYQCADHLNLNCRSGPREGCRLCEGLGCTYESAKYLAKSAKLVNTNYAYWIRACKFPPPLTISEKSGQPNPFDCLIADESALAPEILASQTNGKLHQDTLDEARIDYPEGEGNPGLWAAWAREHIDQVAAEVDNRSADLRKSDSRKRGLLRNKIADLEDLLESMEKISGMNDDDWIVEQRIGTSRGRTWDFDCIWPGAYAERYLFAGIPNVVLMSATLKPVTLRLLGLSKEKYDYREWDRVFPAQNTPIYCWPAISSSGVTKTGEPKAVGLSRNTSEEDWAKVIENLDKFIDRFGTHKGIVHSGSYDVQRRILEGSRHSGNMMANTRDKDSDTAVEVAGKFRASEPPAILVSPSFSTGWDFPGDQCRWIWIAKLPFPALNTKIMKARAERDDRYIPHLVIQDLEQSSLRGSRYHDDWCVVCCGDGNLPWFYRLNKNLANSWWGFQTVWDCPPMLKGRK